MRIIYYSENDHNSIDYIPAEYDTIVKKGQDIVKKIMNNNMKQVLVVQTTGNKIYESIIDLSSDTEVEEQKLLNAIGKNDAVIRLVCCWNDGSFDMPSYHFRKKLCELNGNNEKTQMLLKGENRYILKYIRDTFSKP